MLQVCLFGMFTCGTLYNAQITCEWRPQWQCVHVCCINEVKFNFQNWLTLVGRNRQKWILCKWRLCAEARGVIFRYNPSDRKLKSDDYEVDLDARSEVDTTCRLPAVTSRAWSKKGWKRANSRRTIFERLLSDCLLSDCFQKITAIRQAI